MANITEKITGAQAALWQKAAAIMLTCCLSVLALGGCSEARDGYFPADTSTTEGVLSSFEAAHEYALDEGDFALRSNARDSDNGVDVIPDYSGIDVIELNHNTPQFTDVEKEYTPFEFYGNLDELGRCTVAFALAGPETMPTERRGNIREIYPSGWDQAFYDFVDQEALYNRTHLIGYMLTAENANERNLITGTRHLNAEVMLPYEEAVANYIDETGNHVLYRVTPYFVGNELVARGVQMEAYSVEDNGAGISFNIFCYNTELGVAIDYSTGESWLADTGDRMPAITYWGEPTDADSAFLEESLAGNPDQSQADYVLNTKSRKFHNSDCPSINDIAPGNCQSFEGARETLIDEGYAPCGSCNP